MHESRGTNWKIDLRDLLTEVIINEFLKRPTNEDSYSQIGQYYTCSAPSSLYKYCAEKGFNLIRNNQIFFSSPQRFNDVFDCELNFDFDAIHKGFLKSFEREQQQNIAPGSFAWNQVVNIIKSAIEKFQFVFDEYTSKMGITCFSERCDSLLMWAHYSDSSRGICVEYDIMDMNNQKKYTPIPVIYSNNKVIFDSLNLETVEGDAIRLLINSLTTKSLDWNYEHEWRIVFDNKACGLCWDDEKQGAIMDMVKPKSIILGCNVRGEFEESVTMYCEENEVNLFKMEKDPKLFCFNKKQIY